MQEELLDREKKEVSQMMGLYLKMIFARKRYDYLLL